MLTIQDLERTLDDSFVPLSSEVQALQDEIIQLKQLIILLLKNKGVANGKD